MAASTPAHGTSVWGSVVILAGLPSISGRGGDGALESPGSVEVVPFSPLGSGAALMPGGTAVAAEGASGVVVVLAVVGAAGAAPMVSGVPPALGGSVVLGAMAAPGADSASVDARSSSSPAARGGIAGVAVDAGSGPGVVWPVFLFFLLFFSSFVSSAPLERSREKGVRGKVSQEVRILCRNTHEASRSTHPLLPGRAEGGGGGAEDSPAGFLPRETPASGRRLARSSLNLERRSASRQAWRPSSSRSREEDTSASPLVGWSGGAESSPEESESTTVPSGRLRRASRSSDSTSSSSRSLEAEGPAPRAIESCSELAAGALGRGPRTTPSARNGPQALNFKIPAVMRLVSRAPRL
jgi:hypothetical protein